MTMQYIEWANEICEAIAFIAELNDLNRLARKATAFALNGATDISGRYALASIAARAYWVQINGRWIKK